MPTIQATDLLCTIEPVLGNDVYNVGPTDYAPASRVMLTQENLRQIGAYPARVGEDWFLYLNMYQMIAGVETLVDLSTITLTGSYWDPVSRAATALSVVGGVPTGQILTGFLAAGTHVAGMYDFTITGTETEVFDLCSGKIEILPARPVP